MGYFQSGEVLKKVLGGFFEQLASHAEIGPKLLDSKMVIKFIYREPDASITIDLKNENPVFTFDDAAKKADVEMSMKADTAHKFWLGDVNLVVALARREITAKGPIPKILKLLPIIKPAYKLYPDYIKGKLT
ncbi:SCP2 sterol-binding domain-containing protein [bacterium]|nr:SCP2 sterol-binding domain-containing protein [bacterium]